jgi:hypothetical protein
MPHGYFFDTSTNIAVTTDSNTFSTVFNTDYPGNQITGFQLNGVDIGSMITPFVDLSFSTANNYHYSIYGNNINTRFSFTKPKPRVAVTNCASIKTYGIYTLYEFRTGSVGGTFQLNTSIPNIVLDLNVLLIGGGGAGGHYSDGTSGGAGGGGAGSYVTTIIKAPANTSSFTTVYFNINVGAGGAGTGTGNTSGSNGGSSIITYVSSTRFLGNTTFSLTAAGGGSGGSKESPQGIFNLFNINGSTGGACGNYLVDSVTAYSTNAGYTSHNGSIFTEIACSVNRGGSAYYLYGGGGGGGAGGQGQDFDGLSGGNGGNGKTWSINNVTYAGGGGGAKSVAGGADNSSGGSGGGGSSATLAGQSGDAVANTGSGGGAGWQGAAGLSSGNGGSGICIIAVKTSDISL